MTDTIEATDREKLAREVLANGTWAEVISYLRTVKTEDEMITELAASARTLDRWEAGSRMRPMTERLMRRGG